MDLSISKINKKKRHALLLRLVQLLLLIAIGLVLSAQSRAQSNKLFSSDEVLEITLDLDMKALMRDRGDDPEYHQATLKYKEGDTAYDIPLRVRARGNFRKNPANCRYPPLFLNFKKKETPEESIFKAQDKTKLVTPCKGDQFVINEYLAYKLYNIVEPEKSFRARLVKVIYHDNNKGKSTDPMYGILLEEEKQMAKRNKMEIMEKIGFSPLKADKESFLKMAVFQHLIGNTDWSIQYQQNIKLLINEDQMEPITVPYDFDHAGIVRAPYANPAPELKLTSTQERRYRGYCHVDMQVLEPTFELFNQHKEEIFALYEENTLITDGYRKQTLKFLNGFFTTINDPKRAKTAFLYPCDKSGTGNVIIKGLNVD